MRNQRFKTIMIALGVILLFLCGCATCPNYTVVEVLMTPLGPMFIQTEKDNYSEKNHSLEQFKEGTGWVTVQEYEAWLEELEPEETKKLEGAI